ncbi:MAG: HAD family hydrolase [Candidatus Bathyarchaeota archaeon]|nr:MAG: HAD family hydrolase [Candidatus Bathyarchaeota archaeon]
MITTALIDYDGTLHDYDAVLTRNLEGILGLRGEELYHIYVYDVHRTIVHVRHLDRHDDTMFHCKLIFEHLGRPFDPEVAELIVRKFDEAAERAREDPIYFPEAIRVLDDIKDMGIKMCLSTGRDAEEKSESLKRVTGSSHFTHVFSETALAVLKTEPEYYVRALDIAGSEPKETVSIGDTPLSDIRPAKMVGINTIWLNRRGEPVPDADDQTADYEVEDLKQVVQLICDGL